MTEKDSKKLRYKYLQGKASPTDIEIIRKFGSLSAAAHNDPKKDHSYYIRQKRTYRVLKKKSFELNNYQWFNIAASILILFSLGLISLCYTTANEQTMVSSQKNIKTMQMMDGSHITLNKNSHINYNIR